MCPARAALIWTLDRRFDSDFRTLDHLVSQGALGDVLQADMHFDYPDPTWIRGWTQKEHIPGEGMTFALGKCCLKAPNRTGR
jgi:predicted dehydrogenase